MEKSKLAQLLLSFSKEELRELSKFAATPFFNPRPEAAALLRVLSKTLLAGKPLPNKEQLFHQIFDKDTFDDHRVRMAMAALLKTTEKYLTVQDFLLDKPAYQLRLSKVLQTRNLPAQAKTAWQEGFATLEQHTLRNAA